MKTKPILPILFSLAVVATTALAQPTMTTTTVAELLVKCEGGPAGHLARSADAAVGATTLRRFEAIGWHLVRLSAGMNVAQGMARYRTQPGVLEVEPNQTLRHAPEPLPPSASPGSAGVPPAGSGVAPDSLLAAVAPNDPRYGSQWNLKKIGMEQAWAITTGSTNVVVAVIDTGVNYLHPDLAANMWRNPGETGLDAQGRDKATNGIDDDGNGYVDDVYGINALSRTGDPMDIGGLYPNVGLYPHGTACAGVIAAVGNNNAGVTGLNWRTSVMALVQGGGTGAYVEPTADFVECMDYAIRMKRRGVNVRIASISKHDQVVSRAFDDAIRIAGDEGILCVFAAGNETANLDTTLWRWSTHGGVNVLAVGGSTRTDGLGPMWNYGRSTVHLVAPSVEIPTLGFGGSYIPDFNGTSSASPHVAGTAALLCSIKPGISVLELRHTLLGSVDPIPAAQGKTVTGGRLNAARALQSLTEVHSSPPIVVWSTPTGLRADLNAPVEVIFSEAMNRASVEAAFQIAPAISGVFEWSLDSKHMYFRHSNPFQRTRYTIRIQTSAVDASDRHLDGNYDRVSSALASDDFVWTFDFPAANDAFADAMLLDGEQGTLSANTFHSNAEQGEASPKGLDYVDYGTSVWYRWVAPGDGWFTFDIPQSTTINPVLAAYSGTDLSQLVEVTSNIDYGTRNGSRVSFAAIARQSYSISVASTWTEGSTPAELFAGLMGSFTLRWYPTPPPGIVSFTPASAPSGRVVTLNGTNFTGVTRVTINGVAAPFAATTNANFLDLRLLVTVPSGASTGLITVETPHGKRTSATPLTIIAVPKLAIETGSKGSVILSWPEEAMGFTLQASDQLGVDANWRAATRYQSEPSLPGQVRVSITPPQATQFYRLGSR